MLPGWPDDDEKDADRDRQWTALVLAALVANNAATSTARDRFVIATSLLNGGATGQVFLFRKAADSCDLTQTHQINTGRNPYDLIVSPDSEQVYIALDGDSAIAPFRIDASAEQLVSLGTVAQAGPSANPVPYGMSIHPDGRFLYAADGANPGAVAAFNRDTASGTLTAQSPTAYLTAGANMWYATLSRSGNFLYVSNFNGFGDAGNDSVYGYSVNQSTGALTLLGSSPFATQNRPWYIGRHLSQDWLYVSNHGTGSISMFQINTSTGALTGIGGGTIAAAGNPIGLAVGQRFLFAADNGGGNIYGYTIDQSTGALTANGTTNPGAPVPYGLALDTDERCLYVARTDESGATSNDVVSVYDVSTTGALSFRANLTAGLGPRFLAIVRR